MGMIASQITSLTIVYSTVDSDTDQRKHQSSASLAFVWEINRQPVNSPHKWPVTQKMFPFDDLIMENIYTVAADALANGGRTSAANMQASKLYKFLSLPSWPLMIWITFWRIKWYHWPIRFVPRSHGTLSVYVTGENKAVKTLQWCHMSVMESHFIDYRPLLCLLDSLLGLT